MKISFQIDYHTTWGERLVLLSDRDGKRLTDLSTHDGYTWVGEMDLHADTPLFAYRYAVFMDDNCVRREFGALPHYLRLSDDGFHHYSVKDCWRDLPRYAYTFSSAFAGAFVPPADAGHAPRFLKTYCLRVLCPGLSARRLTLAMAGECDYLGNWNGSRGLSFVEVEANVWQLSLDVDRLPESVEYKLVARREDGEIVYWEEGANRQMLRPVLNRGEVKVAEERECYFSELTRLRVAGSAIPVFSLRTEGSCGVGDFGDLRTYLEWAASTGQKAVQILPINDTTATHTWKDSYPYNAISIYAFHPMYVDLRQLPVPKRWKGLAAYEAERQALNRLSTVDYEGVNRLKRAYLRAVYDEVKDVCAIDTGYRKFYQTNAEWLLPYAAFRTLADWYGTNDFSRWETFANYDAASIAAFTDKHKDETGFHCYVQYLLHCQLLNVSQYARSKQILLKGDIPIGINRCSVEAWTEPHYFHMDGQAGAPPDSFSVNGQNWGFPTYNWEVMAGDNYRWWRRRFAKMADYFTAYRIDHILGFFRIWEIPNHAVHGLLGQFAPALPMSRDEIQGYGFPFAEWMTQPFIDDGLLTQLFGNGATEVKRHFLVSTDDGRYAMQPEFDTERKVEAFFSAQQDETSSRVKEGLYALISNVLFVCDRSDAQRYHPRIIAQTAPVFEQLTPAAKEAFNRLYEDYYYHRHNEFWYREAMKKLPVLTQSTPMLVCGEDLGMVPDCVAWVMNELQLLSLEIQRMPKAFGIAFGVVEQYPLLSVCTIGTHDMTTLRGWWKEDGEVAERFFREVLQGKGEVPAEVSGEIAEKVVWQHLNSPSMLAILTWQDWLAMDERLRNPDVDAERINIPANPRHYWRWRMHLTIEALMQEANLNERIRRLIEACAR